MGTFEFVEVFDWDRFCLRKDKCRVTGWL